MGAHDHKHVHCDHPHLKYCTRCQVVHCLDCGHEWPDKTYDISWYKYYQQQPSWGTYTTSPSGCASTGNTVFCNHGDDR